MERERILRKGRPGYPRLLAEIPEPPRKLHVRGRVGLLGRTAVAIVGSRSSTDPGVRMAERLAAGLAGRGAVVVSGCARGIDAAAHDGALRVGGDTVAVLAGGLDVAAPRATEGLAREIARRGCLVGEHPPGVPPLRHHFPRRNRIIAGLARIVVVVEAGGRSGALITARHGLEAGREVMAVPGHPLLDNSIGVNRLIAEGARPVRTVDDVLDELVDLPGIDDEPPEGTAGEGPPVHGSLRGLLDALTAVPRTAEVLARELASPVAPVLAGLTELEILGLARSHPGQRFSKEEEE